ncbi:MAG: hypothetical protein ACFE89_02540 [Candidatus Hodarchaeota archaeon]
MGLMDIFFGPFERYGIWGGFIWPIIIAIITGIAGFVWILQGASPIVVGVLVLDTLLTYGVLIFFFYVMYMGRPK